MNIVVCIKQVLDPELPVAKFKVDAASKRVVPPESLPPVLNPFDAQAIEVALQLKDRHGASVTALSIGDKSVIDIVRYALSMGVDRGVVVATNGLDRDLDGSATAYLLSKAIQKLGSFDCVLCGAEAADLDRGVIGPLLAHNLRVNLVTGARRLDWTGAAFTVERAIEDGFQVFETGTPALITVNVQARKPRLPSGYGIVAAARKQVVQWSESDIAADGAMVEAMVSRCRLLNLYIPVQGRKCEFVEGGSPAEIAANLAPKLRGV